MTSQAEAVAGAIDRQQLLADVDALIRIQSLGGHEDAAQAWMATRLRALGCSVDEWAIDMAAVAAHPSFCMEVPRAAGRGVVGTLHGTGTGPTLIFNGHVDVVPTGDLARWTVDPWRATVRDGRVYGRGACDMKGGLAAALAAMQAIRSCRVPLPGAIAFHSVIAEEDGGAGTLATLLRGHRGDGAISMEPTRLCLAPAHAGALSFRVRVPGLATHGCVREEGVSAIEAFEVVHRALRALEAARCARLANPLFATYALPYALSIGTLRAGDWPSSVPDLLVCEGRYGMAPGEDAAAARGEFEDALERTAATDCWLRDHPPTVEWWGGQFMPARTADNARISAVMRASIDAVTGQPARVEGMTYGADMRLLVNDGHIPTVLFGAGDVRQAHGPDEWVGIDDLLTSARVLAVAALDFCSAQPS